MAGKQPAPADLKLTFQHHFLKSDKNVYVPYIVEISGGKFSSFPVTMYVRAVQKACGRRDPQLPASGTPAKAGDSPPDWPFADVYFLTEKNITTTGDVSEIGRALELPPGEYTLYIAMRERQPKDKKQGPPKAVVLAQPLSVPDMNKGLTTSSVILAKGARPGARATDRPAAARAAVHHFGLPCDAVVLAEPSRSRANCCSSFSSTMKG